MAREKLPEAKEIRVDIKLDAAKRVLSSLPADLKEVKNEIEKALERVEFWNFLRNCGYLESERADFHLTGLGTPGWYLYCTHPDRKQPYPDRLERKIADACERESCPIYKR